MSKKEEFKFELEKITNIYFLCKESYLVLRELYRVENNSDVMISLKSQNPFFTLTRVNYWRVIVLQLSKLFTDNERFNISKFLSKCQKNNYFASINIKSEFIDSELKKILEKADLISHIKTQRDKLFAHEDYNRDEIVNEVTLDETKELLDLCKNIIFEIYHEVFDTHYDFKVANSPEWNLRKILEDLEHTYQIRKEERKDIVKLLNRRK